MTTNQTIDGVLVPRELLSYWAECLESAGFKDRPAEMRALLDAPSVERKPFGWFRTPKDCPLQGMFLHYNPEHGERDIQNALDFGFTVKRLYETTADQPQGEPVACITLQQVLKAYDYANCHPHKYLRGTTNWCAAVAHSLNAEQPAPVAVVMPERPYASEEDQQNMTEYEIGLGHGACEMWDKIKSLNTK